MTRRRSLSLAIGVAILLASAVPAQAASGSQTAFRGRTSTHTKVGFKILQDHRKTYLSWVNIGADLTCPSGATFGWGISGSYGRWGPLVTSGHFEVDENWGDVAFHFQGDIAGDRATGTLTFAAANLDENEQPELCSSGDLTWRAHVRP